MNIGVQSHITITISSNLWMWWAEIAIEQERIALDARALSSAATPTGSKFGDALHRETRASLQATCAAAFAIDCLFGDVDAIVSVSRVKGRARWKTILEAFRLAARVQNSLTAEFKWLWTELRNVGVHHKAVGRPSVPHPTGTNTATEVVLYSSENATRAVDLMLDIFETLWTKPRPALAAWVGSRQHVLQQLRDLRK